MIDNSRSCFHGDIIFGSQGQMSLSSNKRQNGTATGESDLSEQALGLQSAKLTARFCPTFQHRAERYRLIEDKVTI